MTQLKWTKIRRMERIWKMTGEKCQNLRTDSILGQRWVMKKSKITSRVFGIWGAQEQSWQSSSGVRNGVANCLQCPRHNSQMPLPFMCTPAVPILKVHIPLLDLGGTTIPAPSPFGLNWALCFLRPLKAFPHGINLQMPTVIVRLIIHFLLAAFPPLDYLPPHLLTFLVPPNKMLVLEPLAQSLLWGTPH